MNWLTRRHYVAHGFTSIFIVYNERLFRLMNTFIYVTFLELQMHYISQWAASMQFHDSLMHGWLVVIDKKKHTNQYTTIQSDGLHLFVDYLSPFFCFFHFIRNRNRTANDALQIISLTLTVFLIRFFFYCAVLRHMIRVRSFGDCTHENWPHFLRIICFIKRFDILAIEIIQWYNEKHNLNAYRLVFYVVKKH